MIPIDCKITNLSLYLYIKMSKDVSRAVVLCKNHSFKLLIVTMILSQSIVYRDSKSK